MSPAPTRRRLMGGAALLALSPLAARAEERTAPPGMGDALREGEERLESGRVLAKYVPAESTFPYEVQRTEEEWLALLDGDEEAYGVLRLSNTEWPGTTDLWETAHEGEYACRGCDLPVYDGQWFVPLEKGWVFFEHSIPNAVMLGVDGPVRQYGMRDEMRIALIEVHCRRCGSHLGHYLPVDGQNLHCINGTSLKTV